MMTREALGDSRPSADLSAWAKSALSAWAKSARMDLAPLRDVHVIAAYPPSPSSAV